MSLKRRAADEPVTMDRIFALSMPEPNSGCWLWMGAYSRKSGYGSIGYGGKVCRVSRVVVELVTGKPVPAHLLACHRCDNPACVNPDHLFLGTDSDNVHDCIAKGRHVAPTRERSGKSKLTQQQVDDIRRSPLPARQLAAAYGVHRNTIFSLRPVNIKAAS
jgi:hypothetical protein